ncbi:GNAT family N-acetyltransferase [Bacillus seohaeanensis]|uniref:Enhanced intracellular survival protein Eis n=1 Tax=Bacillus seohaeanensis TaxID=284580 RepID=A0ABW5RU73_9BACI
MIKRLRQEDYEDIVTLSEYAFQYKLKDEDKEAKRKQFQTQIILGIKERETLAAKLHIIPLEVYMGNARYNMGGIASVSTYPEYRRKGYVRKLLAESLSVMKDNNQTVSMLHPFQVGFYRKFGWELFVNLKKVSVTQEELKPFPSKRGKIKRYNKHDFPDDLYKLYDLYAKDYNGGIYRTKDWWKERSIADLTVGVYFNDSDEAQGYILYTIKDRKMKVEEMISITPDAKKGLWNFICQHDSMISGVDLVLQNNDPLVFMLQNPRVKTEIHPYFMARIVDVEGFLLQHLNNIAEEVHLLLTVRDEVATWNNKTFSVSCDNVKETLVSNQKDITMSIQALAALAFGVYNAKQLNDMGLIKTTREQTEQLTILFPESGPFFSDFF